MKKLFIEPDPQKDERYLFVVYETFVQDFAEANFGRELTDIELNRVAQEMVYLAALSDIVMGFYNAAVEKALDEEEDWSDVDRQFEHKQPTLN